MRTDAEAKQQIVEIACDLFAMGQLTPTGGNISAFSADPELLWITPSQMYKGGLNEDSLVLIRRDGSVVEGTNRPSIELKMHWASYEARPGSTAAVHTHAPAVTAFGITNQAFPPINTDAIALADTQIVPWFMPGSEELAAAVAEAIKVSRGEGATPHRPGRRAPPTSPICASPCEGSTRETVPPASRKRYKKSLMGANLATQSGGITATSPPNCLQ